MHLLRECAHQAGHTHVRTACRNGAWRLPAGAQLGTFATGWASATTCAPCLLQQVWPTAWRRDAVGRVVDFGEIIPAVTLDGKPILVQP